MFNLYPRMRRNDNDDLTNEIKKLRKEIKLLKKIIKKKK
jgi:hypothetical protein